MKSISAILLVFCLLCAGNLSAQTMSKQDSLWLDSARIELKQLTDMKNEALRELGGESCKESDERQLTDYDRLTPEEKERHDRKLEKLRKKAAKKQARENSKGFFRKAGNVIKAIFGL